MALDSLEKRFDNLEKYLDKLITGNGQPGILSRLASLETAFARIDKHEQLLSRVEQSFSRLEDASTRMQDLSSRLSKVEAMRVLDTEATQDCLDEWRTLTTNVADLCARLEEVAKYKEELAAASKPGIQLNDKMVLTVIAALVLIVAYLVMGPGVLELIK